MSATDTSPASASDSPASKATPSDGKQEVRELVPDPGERHRTGNGRRRKAPGAEQRERAGHADEPTTRHHVGQGGRRLGEGQCPTESQAGKRDHPRWGEGDDVERGRGDECGDPGRADRSQHVDDVPVVGHAREHDSEGDAHHDEPDRGADPPRMALDHLHRQSLEAERLAEASSGQQARAATDDRKQQAQRQRPGRASQDPGCALSDEPLGLGLVRRLDQAPAAAPARARRRSTP